MPVKITVGMLAFNVESTLPKGMFEACVKSIYDVAHEIIIVEGATLARSGYWDGDATFFTKDGMSKDKTRLLIKSLPDPAKKIRVVLASTFWNGKTQMCNQWAQMMTGNYIWQVDSDEFYHEEDIKKIVGILEHSNPDAVHFYANHFFGDFNWCIDENTGKGWGNDIPWMRIFKHTPGSYWVTHEPPDYMMKENGRRTLCNKGKVFDREATLKMGIKLNHYGYVCKQQVDFKARFFNNYEVERAWNRFHSNRRATILKGSTAVQFTGQHPREIRKLLGQL